MSIICSYYAWEGSELHVTTGGKAEGKKSPRYRLGCTVNMNFTCDMIELTLAQNLVQWWHVVNMTANLWFPYRVKTVYQMSDCHLC